MQVLRRYGQVLRPPGALPAVVASTAGRTSIAMNGLALLLLVRQATGSYGGAGAVCASYAVALAVAAPVRARAADRHGPVPILRLCAVLHPLAFAAVLALAAAHAPLLLIGLAAVGMGASVPPLGGVVRAMWGDLLTEDLIPAAYSLEAITVELCFIAGPLLVAAVVATSGPAYALALAGALCTSGAVVLSRVPAVRRIAPHPARASHRAGPLVVPQVRALLANIVFIGASFGAIEVGVLAFAEHHGQPRSVAGVVLAVWSVGSVLGGLTYGSLRVRADASRQLPVLAAVMGAACSLPLLAPSVLVLSLLLLLAGTTIAPWNGVNSLVLARVAPAGTLTEAFAWTGSMIFAGGSVGTALSGYLVDRHGPSGAFVVAGSAGLLALGAAMWGVRPRSTSRV